MKHLFYLAVLLIIAMSCVPQTQLITLTSDNDTLNANNFVYSDSLITVSFNFYSRNGLMWFGIYNNSSHPVYIDWQKSGYITSNGKKYNYWTDKAEINANVSGNVSENSVSADINGIIQKDERVSFLPPKTKTEVKKFSVSGGKTFLPGTNKEVVMEKNNWKKSTKITALTQYNYTKEDTPFSFRNYLVVSATENFHDAVYYDFGFWISRILDMNARQLVGDKLYVTYGDQTQPGSKYHPYKRPDRFFIFEK